MPRLAPFALFAALLAAPAPSSASPPEGAMSVRDALALATALRNLDGRPVVIRQNGQDASIVIPWEFGSGSLRMRVAGNLAILAGVERGVDTSRLAILAEIQRGGAEVKPGSPEFEEFQRQYEQLLDGPAPGVKDLAHISVPELKLDRNEIAVTVLQALRPILDER